MAYAADDAASIVTSCPDGRRPLGVGSCEERSEPAAEKLGRNCRGAQRRGVER
jgi:hypothetical protein